MNQSSSKETMSFQDSIFKRSQDNLDNISISSQSSLGMVIPLMSQSPVSQLMPSPTGSLGSRSQTPLSFPLTAEDPEENRPQSQLAPGKHPQRKISRKISFAKLFPQQGPKTGQQELRENACEYCLRVLEQSERRPTKLQDSQIVEAVNQLFLILSQPVKQFCLGLWSMLTTLGRTSNTSESLASIPASVTAFLDPKQRPLFSFILRPEAGHGDTISSLYFSTLLNEAERDTVSKLIPVIMERAVLVYDSQTFQLDIRRILAEQLVLIFQNYPSLVAENQQDLVELSWDSRIWALRKKSSFINQVWSIGEFASTADEGGCTVQMIVQYFETLEALTYEIVMQTSPGKVVFSGKLVSVLMSALAKLASRCQDLIQRAILCCSKVVRQKPELLSDPECYNDLVTRAQELIQLLKLPNVAPVLLNPDAEWITGRWHKDKNTSLPLLLQTTKMIVLMILYPFLGKCPG